MTILRETNSLSDDVINMLEARNYPFGKEKAIVQLNRHQEGKKVLNLGTYVGTLADKFVSNEELLEIIDTPRNNIARLRMLDRFPEYDAIFLVIEDRRTYYWTEG